MTTYAQIETPATSGMTQIREKIQLRVIAGRVFDAVACHGVTQSDLEDIAASQAIVEATRDLAAALTMKSWTDKFISNDESASFGMSSISIEGEIDSVHMSKVEIYEEAGSFTFEVKHVGPCKIEATVYGRRYAREIYIQSILALSVYLAEVR